MLCDGAVGLILTADDLLAFSRMLIRGGSPVLPVGAVAEMTPDQLTPEQKPRLPSGKLVFDDRSWGFCMFVITGGPDAGSYTLGGGLGTTWLVNPVLDLTVIILTQRQLDGGWLPKAHKDLHVAARSAAA